MKIQNLRTFNFRFEKHLIFIYTNISFSIKFSPSSLSLPRTTLSNEQLRGLIPGGEAAQGFLPVHNILKEGVVHDLLVLIRLRALGVGLALLREEVAFLVAPLPRCLRRTQQPAPLAVK